MAGHTLVLAPRALLGVPAGVGDGSRVVAGARAVAGARVVAGSGVVAGLRPAADGPRGDPYRLRTRVRALIAAAEETHQLAGSIDHVLVVVPRRRGVAATMPAVAVDGGGRRVPVGVVFADRAEQLPAWLGTRPDAADRGPVIGAMGTNRFLDPAGRWIAALDDAGFASVDRRACRTDRAGFTEVLASGPSLAIYLGHGHHLGFGGYQELRYEDLPVQQRPIGVLIALACSTLAQPSGRAGFGRRLVAEGRARTVIGAVRPCRIDDLLALGDALVELITDWRGAGPPTVGAVLVELIVLAEGGGRAELSRALAAIRIVGDPASPVAAGSGVREGVAAASVVRGAAASVVREQVAAGS